MAVTSRFVPPPTPPLDTSTISPRLRCVLDLDPTGSREGIGLHEYDGTVADYSPAGVRAAMARLGTGSPPSGSEPADAIDAALLATSEATARLQFGELESHRWNPLVHAGNLDVTGYDRAYAPLDERRRARAAHLARWPDAVDGAIESLDQVTQPVARALLPSIRALGSGVDDVDAVRALDRLVAHLEHAAANGDPDARLGATRLTALFGVPQHLAVDLGELARRATAERARLRELLAESCSRLRPGVPTADVVAALLDDHPDTPEGIYAEARAQIVEATAFTLERDLMPPLDGECLVGPAPPSKSWAMAMMSWAGAYEPDNPAWYYVTPPDPAWSAETRAEWLAVFSRTTLPPITVHEVMPGHFAHSRRMRRVESHERRCCLSNAFIEGWAHYAEELFVEEGFRADDPRFAAGVAIEALVRVTRLAVTIGIHTGAMTVADGAAMFAADAYLRGEAANSEANRATFDPTYGRYTWGKLEILAARERARSRWGNAYSHKRFHTALLDAGAPPLGLLDAVVEVG
jgi:hypothetical protein